MLRRSAVLWHLVLFAICMMNGSFHSAKLLHEQDVESLLIFKKMVESDPNGALVNWHPNSIHYCNWSNVECNSAGRVVKLDLYSMQIQGTISPSLGNLSYLTYLDLCNNSFHGTIPPQLGTLKNLQTLYLCENRLQGTIPDTFTNLTQLQILSIAQNNLHGSIPHNIGHMFSLQILALQTNNLSGSIPSSIGNLSSLEQLYIYRTPITGTLPQEICKLKNLMFLYVFENPQLAGDIPESVGNMSRLSHVNMHQNAFTGYVPSQLGTLENLSVLYLSGNNLIGSIPPSLGNCSNLRTLVFDKNQLTGVISLQFGRLSLTVFRVMSNRLVNDGSPTISILSAFSNCSTLNVLDLSSNKLKGMLPEVFPFNLSTLLLNGNFISGPIPWKALGKLENLINLDLSDNKLTGRVSGSVGEFKKIQRIALGNNKLQGSIPSEIGRLGSTLYELSIQNNLLGGIPDAIGNLTNLRRLVLDHNNLSGSIPPSLGQCYKLELLDLSSNKFDGSIPPEVANLYNIQIYFNLSHNSLHGKLPAEIGKMIHTEAINVSANRISGTIPSVLEGCNNLQQLDLSFNEFQESIPRSLSNLENLVSMDLSHNNISGSIPFDLEKLQMLQILNLSFNDLSGEVPEGASFRHFNKLSFLGNPKLCGEWVQLPACTSVANTHTDSKVKIIAPVAACAGVLVICLVFYVSIYCTRSLKDRGDRGVLNCEFDNWKKNYGNRFSYRDISEATGGFNINKLLGSTILASVYRGTLRDGTDVAIKLLNKINQEALKGFVSECKALSMVKHRNLVKIIGFCWEGAHKALVMPLMPKGSLAQALQRENEYLSFREVVNIAMDIAHGLEYLHHYSSIQIIHCDIKPSNILFDEDMVAHVADFGIAKFLCTDSVSSLSSSLSLAGSIGYIPPEYGGGGMVSPKGDVYSYGVTLLEMATGKSPTDENPDGFCNLHSWVLDSFPDKLEQVLHKKLPSECIEDTLLWNCISDFIKMALCCTSENPYQRPDMTFVSRFLEELSKRISV